MSKKIQTTWGKIFENSNMILFNEYPNIINELGKYEELDQFYTYDEEEGYTDEIYQWYIVVDEEDWLERFCPEIYEDLDGQLDYFVAGALYLSRKTFWNGLGCCASRDRD